jgi:hypothetical protein
MGNDNKPDIYTIPPDYYSPELGDIWRLIKNIDGYRMFGEQLGDLANEICKNWHANGKLPENRKLLKACLFYESRRSRFVTGYPQESDMPYLRALKKGGFDNSL